MQPTFISTIKRPTSGPLLWLHSLNRSFIWIFFPSNETQAADTPTETGGSFRQELFWKYLPHSKMSTGHTPIISLLEPSMILHKKRYMSYLLKKNDSFKNCVTHWIQGFLKTYRKIHLTTSLPHPPPLPLTAILPLLLSPSST